MADRPQICPFYTFSVLRSHDQLSTIFVSSKLDVLDLSCIDQPPYHFNAVWAIAARRFRGRRVLSENRLHTRDGLHPHRNQREVCCCNPPTRIVDQPIGSGGVAHELVGSMCGRGGRGGDGAPLTAKAACSGTPHLHRQGRGDLFISTACVNLHMQTL